jgi:hypothetical protein
VNGIILISLFLNFICIYLIVQLWKKLQQISNVKNTTDVSEDIEAILELFTQEMKEENENLRRLISDFAKNSSPKSTFGHDEATNDEKEDQNDADFTNEVAETETAKVVQLAKQGYNAEEIAKMLNRGKGEIELLLKFYA